MKTFSIEKKQIKKIKETIENLLISQKNHELVFLSEISNFFITNKFIDVNFGNYKHEYWYCSTQVLNMPNLINGIKITINNELIIGQLDLNETFSAKDYSELDPAEFFKKINKSSDNLENYETQLVKECLSYKPKIIQNDSSIKAVAYCRLSKGKSKCGYNRQINKINNVSKEYEIVEFFKEIISGTTQPKERQALNDLVLCCKSNNIKCVFVSELNRLGRKENIIMNTISFLRKNGIDEIHVLREDIIINEDYIKHHYQTLKALARNCEEDRNSINDRLRGGCDAYIKKCKEEGIKMGRPIGYKKTVEKYKNDYPKEIELLQQGISYRKISTITGVSVNTVKRLNKILKENDASN